MDLSSDPGGHFHVDDLLAVDDLHGDFMTGDGMDGDWRRLRMRQKKRMRKGKGKTRVSKRWANGTEEGEQGGYQSVMHELMGISSTHVVKLSILRIHFRCFHAGKDRKSGQINEACCRSDRPYQPV